MTATLATVEAYLTAAQTALGNGDYQEVQKQLLLGEIELAKLPKTSEIDGATRDEFRGTFDKIRAALKEFKSTANAASATRRIVSRPV